MNENKLSCMHSRQDLLGRKKSLKLQRKFWYNDSLEDKNEDLEKEP